MAEAWRDEAERYSQRYITVCSCGGAGYVRLNVPLGHRLFGKAVPCVCRRDSIAKQHAQDLRRLSGMSDVEMSQWMFGTFEPRLARTPVGREANKIVEAMRGVKRQCETYAKTPQGWLVLYGVPGTGKTHLAYAIASECLARDVPVYAHSVPEMLEMLRGGYDTGDYARWLAMIQGVDMLVLDDLGAQRETGWSADTLYQIVNHRYSKRLPMVVTTNVDLAGSEYDHRIISRLKEGSETAHGWSRWLTLPCGDFRPWHSRREGRVA